MELSANNDVTQVTQPKVTDAADNDVTVLTTTSGYQQLQDTSADCTHNDQLLYMCLDLITDTSNTNALSTGALQHTSTIADADSSNDSSKSIKNNLTIFLCCIIAVVE